MSLSTLNIPTSLTKKIKFWTKRILKIYILGVVKRNPLFLHEIEWKNNGFLFTTPNILKVRIARFKFNKCILKFKSSAF